MGLWPAEHERVQGEIEVHPRQCLVLQDEHVVWRASQIERELRGVESCKPLHRLQDKEDPNHRNAKESQTRERNHMKKEHEKKAKQTKIESTKGRKDERGVVYLNKWHG